jgi:hypothetical protein
LARIQLAELISRPLRETATVNLTKEVVLKSATTWLKSAGMGQRPSA